MVNIVTSMNKDCFGMAIENMHADRKRVFVDLLKWDVPVVENQFEVDQFDGGEAVYLVVTSPDGEDHLGSVRLLPSTGPHILGSIFPELCASDVPVGPNVWEITRLCISPRIRRAAAMRVHRQLAMAIVEFGLLRDIDRFTLVTNLSHVPALLAVGWDCEPLGLPRMIGSHMLAGMAINISPTTLSMLRDKERTADRTQAAALAA